MADSNVQPVIYSFTSNNICQEFLAILQGVNTQINFIWQYLNILNTFAETTLLEGDLLTDSAALLYGLHRPTNPLSVGGFDIDTYDDTAYFDKFVNAILTDDLFIQYVFYWIRRDLQVYNPITLTNLVSTFTNLDSNLITITLGPSTVYIDINSSEQSAILFKLFINNNLLQELTGINIICTTL